jgi:hypothetical protein
MAFLWLHMALELRTYKERELKSKRREESDIKFYSHE